MCLETSQKTCCLESTKSAPKILNHGRLLNRNKILKLTLHVSTHLTLVAKLKKGTGIGGKTASLLQSPEKKSPPKPVAGALAARPVEITLFRKFYDRGDFPIAVQHG